MIVVAIIAILLGIAIPSLLRSRIASNETSAINTLRTIVSAETMYKANEDQNVYGFLSDLSSTTPGYVDDELGNAIYHGDGSPGGTQSIKSGYAFEVDVLPAEADADYSGDATPVHYNKTGNRSFFVNGEGVIRFNDTGVQGGVAESWDPPIDG